MIAGRLVAVMMRLESYRWFVGHPARPFPGWARRCGFWLWSA